MKKLKYALVSLSLVLCFLFLTACGGDSPVIQNQLDIKPTIDIGADSSYSTILDDEDIASLQDKQIKYDSTNVKGISYYAKFLMGEAVIEMNARMKITFGEDGFATPNQIAMKMKMDVPADEETPAMSMEIYMYVRDFAENKVYVKGTSSLAPGQEMKEYYNCSFDNLITSLPIDGIENPTTFDPSNIYSMIQELIGEETRVVSFASTEKDSNNILKYKVSLTETTEGTTPVTESFNAYIIVKEVGEVGSEEFYFQGMSVDYNMTMTDGEEVSVMNISMVVSLFSDDIDFPADLNTYPVSSAQGSPIV